MVPVSRSATVDLAGLFTPFGLENLAYYMMEIPRCIYLEPK